MRVQISVDDVHGMQIGLKSERQEDKWSLQNITASPSIYLTRVSCTPWWGEGRYTVLPSTMGGGQLGYNTQLSWKPVHITALHLQLQSPLELQPPSKVRSFCWTLWNQGLRYTRTNYCHVINSGSFCANILWVSLNFKYNLQDFCLILCKSQQLTIPSAMSLAKLTRWSHDNGVSYWRQEKENLVHVIIFKLLLKESRTKCTPNH